MSVNALSAPTFDRNMGITETHLELRTPRARTFDNFYSPTTGTHS